MQYIGSQELSVPQAHTCGNMLEVPDYWAALAASDAVARALMEGPAVAGPLDLEGRLERLVEARLRVAVLHACTYEVEGGPSLGTSPPLPMPPLLAGIMVCVGCTPSETWGKILQILAPWLLLLFKTHGPSISLLTCPKLRLIGQFCL